MSIVCESSMNLYCSFEMEYLVGVLLCVVTFAAAGQLDTKVEGDVGGQLEGQITGQLEGGGTDSRLSFSQSAGIDTNILADLAGNTDNDATSVSVPEGTTTTITTFTVSGTTGVQDWTITNSLFELTPVTENNMLVVNLTVAAGATLDYETASTVTSNFTVTDNNNITGTIAMTLTLDDVNEAPVFNPASYVVAVADGSGEGTVAVTLTATDPEGTGVTYTLLSGNPGGDWSLDEATGVISVATRKAVDTATTPIYELVISATDGGDPSQTSSTTVTINGVLTFNQTDEAGTSDAPLRGNTAADVSAITVAEGTTATIVKFTIGGATGNTTWTSSNGDLRVIPESPDVGALTVAAGHTLDYEAGTTVTSTLTVVDSAATPATGIISLTLTLTDINDNAPADSRLSFSQSAGIDTNILADLARNTDTDATSVSVPEGTAATITTFTVSGTTGARDWTITNSLFELTPVTENNMLVVDLTVAAGATLDYETASTVMSNFTVTDNSGITGTITMTLTLDDVNEAPVFNPASYIVAVADGSAEGTVAVTLTATDPEGTGVTYTLLSGNPGGDWSLDEATGVISVATRKAVDTATTPVYELAISATDGGDPSQTSSTTVTINGVLTFNQTDEAGTSDAPLRGNTAADVSAITVSEGTTATIVKFKIGGATGNTTWTSSNGDLRVIPESSDVGALTVAAGHTLDYEAGTTVTSTLTVVDSAATPATGIISLTLTLTDINDNAPTFTSTSIDAYITDGSAGSVVTTVTAIDADGTPENSNLVYAIRCYGTNVETGNERHRTYMCSDLKFETDYEVESYTGVIKVASGHTVNSVDQYELLIKATDTGVYPGQFTATTSVVINNVSSAPSVNAGVVFLQLMGAIFTIL